MATTEADELVEMVAAQPEPASWTAARERMAAATSLEDYGRAFDELCELFGEARGQV